MELLTSVRTLEGWPKDVGRMKSKDVNSLLHSSGVLKLNVCKSTHDLLLASCVEDQERESVRQLVKCTEESAYPHATDFLHCPDEFLGYSEAGEDMYHRLVDGTLDGVFVRCQLLNSGQRVNVRQNRNTSSGNTTSDGDIRTLAVGKAGKPRPDIIFMFRGTESFIVEAKKGMVAGTIQTPLDELASKHRPNALLTGDAPFIPGMAIKGTHVQFALIEPDPQHHYARFKSTRIGQILDLVSRADRVKMLIQSTVMYEVWMRLLECWPKKPGPSYAEPLVKGTAISVRKFPLKPKDTEEIFIRKELSENDDTLDWKDVRELYIIADTRKIPCLIRCHQPGLLPIKINMEQQLRLYPTGYPRSPRDARELFEMVDCVLQALEAMHEASFVHRDVRSPNVVRLPNGTWMLVDLERARRLNGDGSAEWPSDFNPEYLPVLLDVNDNEISTDDLAWIPAYDVWQLIKTVNVIIENWTNGGDDIAIKLLNAMIQHLDSDADHEKINRIHALGLRRRNVAETLRKIIEDSNPYLEQ